MLRIFLSRLFKNKLIVFISDENVRLFIKAGNKIQEKGCVTRYQDLNNWQPIFDNYFKYPVEVYIDNSNTLTREENLYTLHFFDRYRLLYYKMKSFRAAYDVIGYVLTKDKQQQFITFGLVGKANSQYLCLDWILKQKNLFLGVRLFPWEAMKIIYKLAVNKQADWLIFFITDGPQTVRQIVIHRSRIILFRSFYIPELAKKLLQKIIKETEITLEYLQRHHFHVSNKEIVFVTDDIAPQECTAAGLNSELVHYSFSDAHRQLGGKNRDEAESNCLTFLKWIISQPSPFILTPKRYYWATFTHFINQWLVCLTYSLFFIAGVFTFLYGHMAGKQGRQIDRIIYEIEGLKQKKQQLEAVLKNKDIKGLQDSLRIYEEIQATLHNPLEVIERLLHIISPLAFRVQALSWTLNQMNHQEIALAISVDTNNRAQDDISREFSHFVNQLKEAWGKNSIILISTPFHIENHETYSEELHRDNNKYDQVVMANIKIRIQ